MTSSNTVDVVTFIEEKRDSKAWEAIQTLGTGCGTGRGWLVVVVVVVAVATEGAGTWQRAKQHTKTEGNEARVEWPLIGGDQTSIIQI